MTTSEDLKNKLYRLDINFGVIKVIGIETKDFLQRISTNDFSKFEQGKTQSTLFISAKGRLIDRIIVLHCGEYFLFLVTRELITIIIDWLNKYIIMEDIFFENISDKLNLLVTTQPIHKDTKIPMFCIQDTFGLPVYVSIDHNEVAVPNIFPKDEWEIFQMNLGIAASPYEINDHNNPLEVNLANLINFRKGCYIGQEIIARLDSYKKIQKALYLISVEYSGTPLESSILVDEENNEIGKITRMMPDPDHQLRNIGLAIIRIHNAKSSINIRIKDTSSIVSIKKSFEYLYGRN